MKKIALLFLVLLIGCNETKDITFEKNIISQVLDNWHKAAAAANFDNYFNAMA